MAISNTTIGNNIIYTQRKGSTGKDSVETVLLGSERVDVGVNSGNKEIATDPTSGYKFERDSITSKTVYNLQTRKNKCFFVLDLETGQRGWYPGCIQIADITEDNIDIKSEASETSQTLITVSNVIVQVLDLVYDTQQNIWYNIKYNDITGYVRNTHISNVRYSDPI